MPCRSFGSLHVVPALGHKKRMLNLGGAESEQLTVEASQVER